MDADMGATLWAAEEEQIPRTKQAIVAWMHCDGCAEPFLLIGIPR
jgi:hypothetical protein